MFHCPIGLQRRWTYRELAKENDEPSLRDVSLPQVSPHRVPLAVALTAFLSFRSGSLLDAAVPSRSYLAPLVIEHKDPPE